MCRAIGRAVELFGSVSSHSASFLYRLWQFAVTASYSVQNNRHGLLVRSRNMVEVADMVGWTG